MLKGLNATKTWTAALLLALIVILIGTLLGLRMAQQRASAVLTDKVQARGWDLHIDNLKINLAGKARADEICISLAQDAHNDLCIEGFVLQLRPMALLRKHIHVQKLWAQKIRIDSTPARLKALRSQPDEDVPTEGEETARTRRMPVLDKAQIEHIDLRLRTDERHLHLTLDDAIVRPDHDVSTFRAQGQFLAFEGGSDALVRGLQAAIGQQFQISAMASMEDGLREASVTFDERLRVNLPTHRDAILHFDAVSFEAPYSVRMHGPTVELSAPKVRFAAAELETNVGVWTRHLPNFYFSSFRAERPTLTVNAEELDDVLAALGALTAAEKTQDVPNNDTQGRAKDDAQPVPSASSPASDKPDIEKAHSVFGEVLAQLTQERTWWEVLPRAIELTGGALNIERDNVTLLQVHDIDLRYAVRVLHQQMDLEVEAQLRHHNKPAGALDGRLEWNYTSKIGRFFWTVKDASVQALTELVAPSIHDAVSGQLASEGRLRINKKQQFSGEHRTTLKDVLIAHERFSKPVKVQHLSLSGDFDHVSQRNEKSQSTTPDDAGDDAPRRPPFVLKQQELRLEESRATLHIEWTDFHPLRRPIATNVYVDLDIPSQPAMTVFSSIPQTIRGPLDGTQMQGDWGLRVAFNVEHTGFDAQERPTWEIHAPVHYDVRDKGLSLVSLPEEVDVQRLNGAMDFVFRGPDDGFMRPLHIPSPQRVKASAETENSSSSKEPPRANQHAWVPLQNMSFYFIATQLYREDGSFFKNSGINWLQIRHVLSDALTTRRVARGASTITMQTVKNVFLTHDKSAERKLQELFLAYWMTRTVPKDRILEVYLNIIELCPACNGADEASRFHFDVPIGDLDVRPSVWLSTISPNPTAMGGTKPKGKVGYDECPRCDQILRGLHSRGWINAREYRKATVDPTPKPAPVLGMGDERKADTETSLSAEASDTSLAHLRAEQDDDPNDAFVQALPWMQGPDVVLEEEPPLFDMLTEDDDEGSDFERLSVDERLRTWIDGQRPLRGAR